MTFPTVRSYAAVDPITSIAIPPLGMVFRPPRVNQGPTRGSWKYNFFLTTTSTPANVYQDAGLTTAFSPTGVVTADAFGRFPAIYLDNAVTYKVQLLNATSVVQRTTDPYTPSMATTGFSQLAASIGMVINSQGEITITEANAGGTAIAATVNAGPNYASAIALKGNQPGQALLIIDGSVTTGAQTATFTATNKPGTATSTPAGWLPIQCDGVTYYTPIWHGNNFTPYTFIGTQVNGQTINATSITFNGDGTSTVGTGTVTPSSWFTPPQGGIGASFYINITKTGGNAGQNFSNAQGVWTNITGGGLNITSVGSAAITGTYQLSTSITGSPVSANGTIRISGNNGPFTQNIVTDRIQFNTDGTTSFAGAFNWYNPTTGGIGASYWINLTQTGGVGSIGGITPGVWTLLSPAVYLFCISGPWTASYQISTTNSSSGVQATGLINAGAQGPGPFALDFNTGTFTGGGVSTVDMTVLSFNGNGTMSWSRSGTPNNWFSTTANIGSSFWIKVHVNSGSYTSYTGPTLDTWVNITNSGQTLAFGGVVNNVSVTYQISGDVSGVPISAQGNATFTNVI
jgi:hypothetical protein